MKKYVSKDDVQKGLVDPTKPLEDQKEYLSQIEKKEEKKHNKDFKKRQRKDRPVYNWNRRDVTLETQVPAAPKKAVPKPDKDKFHDQLRAYRDMLDNLHEQKNTLFNEMKFALKNNSDNKRTGDATRSKFSAILKEKNNLKKILEEEYKTLEQKKLGVENEMKVIKNKIQSLRKPENFSDCSTEELKRRLQKIQQRLTTADLTKNQENRTNQKILEIKRAIPKSRPQVQLSAEIGRLQNQDDLLYAELKNIKGEVKKKYDELRAVGGEIAKIMQQKNEEKVVQVQVRTPEQIKTDYEARIEKIKAEREGVKMKIQKHKDAYFKNVDEFEDYNDLMSYIKMVNEEKEKIKNWKEEQEKKKKEKEQKELQKKKEFEEREKRRQEKKKRDEERKKYEEQKREKLQKEREEFLNRNPHHQKIETCKQLISYCEELKPENVQRNAAKIEEKTIHQPIQELPKDWQKEQKKGMEVIISKKLKEDEEGPKKAKKEKKKKEKEEEEKTTGFTHHPNINNLFNSVNLLPPYTASEIDDIIKQLQDKIAIFEKPTAEEIENFKVKAEKQFDMLHGLGHDRHKKGGYVAKDEEVKEEREKPRPKKTEGKVKISSSDFPQMN